MKKTATIGLVVGSIFLALSAAAPVAAQAAPVAAVQSVVNPTRVRVTGTLADGTGAVRGTFAVARVIGQGGALAAVGTFTGAVTDGAGAVRQGSQALTVPLTTSSPAAAPGVAAAAVDCPVLHLNLAPLNVNLLGLVVDLDRVLLDIVAQPGAGNLLGNLLCAVTGLLDGAGTITQIVGFLNQLLALLAGLGF